MKYSKLHLAKQAISHKGFIKKIPDIFRMVKMWKKGEYPMRSIDIILPLLGLLYVKKKKKKKKKKNKKKKKKKKKKI